MGNLLYKKGFTSKKIDSKWEINEFVPKISGLYLGCEKHSLKTTLLRLYFWLITKGKAKIVYVLSDDGKLVHTSYLIPKCMKFPFLKQGDYEIGPCFTHDDYRGRGIYPCVLNFITSSEKYKNSCFYMIVHETNISSIKGIEKAQFEQCGRIQKTKILKRYCLVRK